MEKTKHKVVVFWLTHIFLRRIGKRYPDFFNKWIADTTDNRLQRKVMAMRYTGDTQMKFEAIALELNISVRRVFKIHKDTVERLADREF